MTYHELSSSSFEVYRPVRPTAELGRKMTIISQIGEETVGPLETVLLRRSTNEDFLNTGDTEYTAVPVLMVHVQPVDELEVGLCERKAPEILGLGSTFARAIGRLAPSTFDQKRRPRQMDGESDEDTSTSYENPLHVQLRVAGAQYGIDGTDHLTVKFDRIAETTIVDSDNLRVFAFLPETPSPAAALLTDEAHIIAVATSKLAVGRDIVSPDSPMIVHMPFATMPEDVPYPKREAFMRKVTERCLPLTAQVGPVSYKATF